MATQTTIVTFTDSEPLDGDHPYIDVEFETPYFDEDSYAETFGISLGDDAGAVTVWIKDSSRTGTGFRLLASAQFIGDVKINTTDI